MGGLAILYIQGQAATCPRNYCNVETLSHPPERGLRMAVYSDHDQS